MEIKGKVVVVTGASEGIGKEIAMALANEKVKLALIARNKSKLSRVCNAAKKEGAKEAIGYSCDVRNRNDIERTIKNIVENFGQIDAVINNAGIWQKRMPVEDVKATVVDDVIATNLTGLIHVTRLAIPHLKKQKEAAIINVSSRSGIRAAKGQSVYSAAKYGVRGFTEVLKEDLAETNIRVAGLYQAGTDTKMFEKAGEPMRDRRQYTDPKDLADVVVYMLTCPDRIWLNDVRVNY